MESENVTDDRFKGEITRLLGVVIKKLDGLEETVIANGQKLDILVGQFTDLTGKVIVNDKRLTKVEHDVAELQSNIH